MKKVANEVKGEREQVTANLNNRQLFLCKRVGINSYLHSTCLLFFPYLPPISILQVIENKAFTNIS